MTVARAKVPVAALGFTLVEMMVSMVIASIVLVLAVGVLHSTSDSYGRNTGSVAAEREARAVLTQAAEDLSKAVMGERAEIEAQGSGWRQDRLGFLCLQPPDAQSKTQRVGDLCAVVYYVQDLQIGRDTVRCLLRGFRGSEETFQAVKTGTVDGLYDARPADEPVSFGVLSFEAEPLGRTAEGQWQKQTEEDKAPEAVRMRLVVARRELLGKLRTTADWNGHPLIGLPSEVERSKYLEAYEVIQPFAHES